MKGVSAKENHCPCCCCCPVEPTWVEATNAPSSPLYLSHKQLCPRTCPVHEIARYYQTFSQGAHVDSGLKEVLDEAMERCRVRDDLE